MKSGFWTGLSLLLAFVAIGSTATAGVIFNSPSQSGPGAAVVGVVTPSPNNDNVAGTSRNTVRVTKSLTGIDFFDIVFDVRDSGGTSEYHLTEFVTNNTGVAWNDYHFELGFGVGAGFVASSNGDFLDWDQPHPADSPFASSVFSNVQFGMAGSFDDQIWFDGGVVLPGQSVGFNLHFDVPDHNSPGSVPGGGPNGFQFTLRQIASVPEPATITFLGLGLVGLGFFRRKEG